MGSFQVKKIKACCYDVCSWKGRGNSKDQGPEVGRMDPSKARSLSRGRDEQRMRTIEAEMRPLLFTLNEMGSYLERFEQRKDVV